MGDLSDRLFPMQRCLPGSIYLDDMASHDALELSVLDRATARSFLDWRWGTPIKEPAAALPANTTEQPAFDALYAGASRNADDGSRFIELDGFLIDGQMAAAARGSYYDPVAA